MQIGVDSFGAVISDPTTEITLRPVQRVQNLGSLALLSVALDP